MLAHRMKRASRGSPSELTFMTSSGSTSTPFAIPGAAKVGDLAIFMQRYTHNASVASVPTGFTALSLLEATPNTDNSVIAYKILTAADLGANIAGIAPGNTQQQLGLLISTQNISASGQRVPLITLGFGSVVDGNGCDVSVNSPAMSIVNAGDIDARMAYKVYNSAPANHTWAIVDSSGLQTLMSGFISIR